MICRKTKELSEKLRSMGEEVKSKGEEETWMVESKEWYLLSYAPHGVPTTDHLKLRTVCFSLSPQSIPHGHLAIETLLFSIDPYLRSRFTGNLDGLYFPQFQLNQVYIHMLHTHVIMVITMNSEKHFNILFFHSVVCLYYEVKITSRLLDNR